MAAKDAEEQQLMDEVRIVLAGKSGAGKSTLIASLLRQSKEGIPLTSGSHTTTTNYYTFERNGVKVVIIDTPGFVDGNFESQPNKFDVLVYCMPISPNAKFHDFNPDVMRKLQDIYGKDIWKHCVIALTFSNLVCIKPIEQYKAYIEEYTTNFNSKLQRMHVQNIEVKTLFEHGTDSPPDSKIIVAIPAGNDSTDQVLPGVQLHETSKGWVDEICFEMIKKCKCNDRLAQFCLGQKLKMMILMMLKIPRHAQ